MNRRITAKEQAFREDLQRVFPRRILLSTQEIADFLGFSRVQAKRWLDANDLPTTIVSSPAARRPHRKYRTIDIARALAMASTGGGVVARDRE